MQLVSHFNGTFRLTHVDHYKETWLKVCHRNGASLHSVSVWTYKIWKREHKAEFDQWSVICIIYNLFICTKKRERYFTNEPTKINVSLTHSTWRSRIRGVLSLPPQSLPFFSFSVPAENDSSHSEKVWGLPSLGELQQIVCERCEVLRTRRLCFVWRWRSCGSGRAEGSLVAGASVWGRRRVTRPQRFVSVLAGRPVYEPLQCRGEGRTQSFGREAANPRLTTSFRLFLENH